jgi:membrane associated rhomboid family serine protease
VVPTLFVYTITDWILILLGFVGALGGVFALIDATSRRADAFAAADKQTKGTWVGITVACGAVLVIGAIPFNFFSPTNILWLAAVVGTLVYLLDVRPRLREVQRGNRW